MHGWHSWLSDLQPLLVHGDDAVLVTVARTEGDAPREAGVKMVVTRDRTFRTIGGGALEWHAIERARQILRDGAHPPSRHLERLALEASYGSVITLAFERLSIADLGWVSALNKRYQAGEATVRTVSFADVSPVLLSDAEPAAAHPDCLLWDAGPLLTETLVRAPFAVTVFGAGHVGGALIRVLATLPCSVNWIDDRPAQFAGTFSAGKGGSTSGLPDTVIARISDDPPSCVADAPPASYFIVATYSAALDQAITERILRRADYAYVGVIGSYAKRRALEQALMAAGVDPNQLGRLHCPIGLSGIQGAAPEVIAVSVVAQLLQIREQTTPEKHRPSNGIPASSSGPTLHFHS
jgi:xanthine dehydrogenase accessory factor